MGGLNPSRPLTSSHNTVRGGVRDPETQVVDVVQRKVASVKEIIVEEGFGGL